MNADGPVYDVTIVLVEVMGFVVDQPHLTAYLRRQFDCPTELNGNDGDDDDGGGDDEKGDQNDLSAGEALSC